MRFVKIAAILRAALSCRSIDRVKKLVIICIISLSMLASCGAKDQPHEHTPDDADCQHVQYCIECGEQLAEQGSHDYSEQPDAEKNGYLFYTCRVCGKIEIVNEDGLPVVPVE